MRLINILVFGAVSALSFEASAEMVKTYMKAGAGFSGMKTKTDVLIIRKSTDEYYNYVNSNTLPKASEGALVYQGAFGFILSPNIRAELSYSQLSTRSKMSAVISLSPIYDGDINLKNKISASSLSLYYDFNNESNTTPFLGLAASYNTNEYSIDSHTLKVFHHLQNNALDYNALTYKATKKHNTSITPSIIAGISYKFNDKVSMELSYNLSLVTDNSTAVTNIQLDAATHKSAIMFIDKPGFRHSGLMSLRYNF